MNQQNKNKKHTYIKYVLVFIVMAFTACDTNKNIGEDLLEKACITYDRAEKGKRVFSVNVEFEEKISSNKYLYIKTGRLYYTVKFNTGDSICFTKKRIEKKPFDSIRLISDEDMTFRLLKVPAKGIKSFRIVYTDATYVGSGTLRALKLLNEEEFNQLFTTSELLQKSSLPILRIITDEAIKEENIKGALTIFENGLQSMSVNNLLADYNGAVLIKIRGGSSKEFGKKNLKLELTDSSNRDVALLGMPAEHDWVLHGPYVDISLLRNKFAYNLADDIGLDAPKCKYCELVINNEYQGVYLLTETIKRDKNRLDLKKSLSKTDSISEFLLKIDRGRDILFASKYKTSIDSGLPYYFVSEYPKKHNLSKRQVAQIKNEIDNLEKLLLSGDKAIENKIDLQSFASYFILNELTKNIDAYRLSTFFYKKEDKFHMGPVWDYNFSLGLTEGENGYVPKGWVYRNKVVPLWWNSLMDNATFREAVILEWKSLREKELSKVELFNRIDIISEEFDQVINRNFVRWDIYNDKLDFRSYKAKSYNNEIKMIKNWLSERTDWMDKQLIEKQN